MARALATEEGYVPFAVTAVLQQGLVWDRFYGLALDGILAAVSRRVGVPAGIPGSLIDGGLSAVEVAEWPLPLARCVDGSDSDWHWACGHGQPLDGDGSPVEPGPPDVHRLSTRPDERRAPSVAVRLPADLGGRRGRFRPRLRPVLVTPARLVRWHAVGDPERVLGLLGAVPAVGGRRGAGEGAVLRWGVAVSEPGDAFGWVHRAWDGAPSRPMPIACAEEAGVSFVRQRAGLRPPLFHPVMQRDLAGR